MVVSGVSHSCLLIEPHCGLRDVSITAYIKAIMEVNEKSFTCLGPVTVNMAMIIISDYLMARLLHVKVV